MFIPKIYPSTIRAPVVSGAAAAIVLATIEVSPGKDVLCEEDRLTFFGRVG